MAQNRFQAVDPASLLPAPPEERPLPPLAEKPVMRFCSRDLTMPDAALIHGRMLVAAWEAGLDQVATFNIDSAFPFTLC